MTQVVTTQHSNSGFSEAVLDRRQLLDRCLGSEELAQRCLMRFAQKLRADVESVQQQATDDHRDELIQTAHRVKGSALTVAAGALATSAGALESYARGNGAGESRQLVADFLREVDRFLDAVPQSSDIG